MSNALDRCRVVAEDTEQGFPNANTGAMVKLRDLRLLIELADAAKGYIAEFDAHESAKHTEKHRQYVRDALAALTQEAP